MCLVFFLCRWPCCCFLSYMGASSASLPARREFITRDKQQAARWLQKSGRSTTTISWRLRNIDVAANIVRHITQVSCDAYVNEIMSHVTQTDPVPAPDDEHVAPVSPAPSPVIKQVTPAPAVPHVAPVPVIQYVSPAPVIEYVAPAPAVTQSTVTSYLHRDNRDY